jgi:hypothetical protein
VSSIIIAELIIAIRPSQVVNFAACKQQGKHFLLYPQNQSKSLPSIFFTMHQPNFLRRLGHGMHPIDEHLLIGMG